jgi:hypothetical protein
MAKALQTRTRSRLVPLGLALTVAVLAAPNAASAGPVPLPAFRCLPAAGKAPPPVQYREMCERARAGSATRADRSSTQGSDRRSGVTPTGIGVALGLIIAAGLLVATHLRSAHGRRPVLRS